MGEKAERGGVKISCLVSCNVSPGWQLVRKQGDGDQGLVVTLEVADEDTPADTALLTIMVIIL